MTDDERCGLCNRLTYGDAVTVDFDTQGLTAVCSVCWEKQDVMVPLDYTEDDDER